MRIRKPHHRNTDSVLVSEEDVVRGAAGPPLLKVGSWDVGDDRSNVTTTSSGMEGRAGLDHPSVTTISRQSASPGVSMMLQSDDVDPGKGPAMPSKLEPDDVVGQAELEGSTLSVEHLWQVHDGDEHVTRHYVRRGNAVIPKGGDESLTARLESDGTKRACTSEELRPVHVKQETPSSDMGTLKRKQMMEDQDGEGERDTHPLTAPEGSVLHTLYLQLLAAGSEGMTLKELFTSFKKQTTLPSLASDWKKQVRDHLKNNRHFDEVKGHYLLCDEVVQHRPKRRTPGSLQPHLGVSSRTTTSSCYNVPFLRTTTTVLSTDSAAAQPSALPLPNHEGVQTRRKAYERSVEAVLTQSAIEFEKMQQSTGNVEVTDTRADATVADPANLPVPTSRKRKSSSDNEEALDTQSKTIRGSLQAMQARIVAESGVQKGVPCSRKDDARKWRCPLMAMQGHTLCEHHKALQLRKRAKKQEANKRARRAESEQEDLVGGAHAVEALMDLQGQQPRRMSFYDEAEPMDEDTVTAPNPTEESQVKVVARTSREFSQISSDGEPEEVHTHERAASSNPGSWNEPPPKDNANNAMLLPQVFRNAPKRRYVAAKKTVANVDVVKEKAPEREASPLVRPPTIPPLPALYGMRRKAIKNRSLLSL